MKVGILGSGQLGRMLALAGIPMDIQFVFYSPDSETCVTGLGKVIHGEYDDLEKLAQFAKEVDVITTESENIPGPTLRFLENLAPLSPDSTAIEIAQDRLLEKGLFAELGIPTPEFFAVNNARELANTIQQYGDTMIVKTRRFGYDGKGQASLGDPSQAKRTWNKLGSQPLIAEQRMKFTREVSIIATRNRHDVINFYPLTENLHQNGILLRSAAVRNDPLQAKAEEYTRKVLNRLNYVGTLAFEFFDCNGVLYANEIAPRVHNSGHWTIEGAITSQFENHLRAILGWPLGASGSHTNCVMYNLIGELPDHVSLLRIPGIHLHNYGKTSRPGRKLGHITLCRPNPDIVCLIENLLWQPDKATA